MMLWGLLFVVSALLSLLAMWCAIWICHKRGYLDVPNARSSHLEAVPRLGGMGIAAAFLCSLGIAWGAGQSGRFGAPLQNPFLLTAILIVTGMAATGLYDDLRGLAPAAKFSLQLGLSTLIVYVDAQFASIGVHSALATYLGVLAAPIAVIWLVSFSNFFNFMDGVNGLAGGTAILYGIFFAVLGLRSGASDVVVAGTLMAGCSSGFLIFNFPRARVFMGDSGSLFLGMLAAFMVLQLGKSSGASGIVAGFLVCAPFVFDCTFTLLRRFRYRENIFRPHRSHLYQRLLRAGWSHGRVSAAYWLVQIFLGTLAILYLELPAEGRLRILAFAALFFALFIYMVSLVERQSSADPHSKDSRSTAGSGGGVVDRPGHPALERPRS
jgi:UDP-N-acetylmuramyl pentapeptide phosphotransferase/UDP-N-acetylglucosamine-1-phosphate transferase